MAEISRRTPAGGKDLAACEKAAPAHMSGAADDDPRASERSAKDEQAPNLIGSGEQKLGGGDLDDPRLFYFRALLDGDRFFGGVRRA